jgi:hypothetical protein
MGTRWPLGQNLCQQSLDSKTRKIARRDACERRTGPLEEQICRALERRIRLIEQYRNDDVALEKSPPDLNPRASGVYGVA